ncbi:hypothetical protein DL96DRAFT_1558439 [Flagelloscypha sp. PMI_526]|nr:hypothetical protein DL96DRAFT_1558439 [Flagelloscypha sp. PMI_526]
MLFSAQTKTVKPSPLTKEDARLVEFPLEIIEQIIFYVADVRALFHLLTSSRATSRAAEAALYHTIDLTGLHHGLMERKVFRRWSALLKHLLESPRHAAMVFYVLGNITTYRVKLNESSATQGGFFFANPRIAPSSVELNFQLLAAKLPSLRRLVFPRDDGPLADSLARCSSNVIRELEMHSIAFYIDSDFPGHAPLFPFLTLEKLNAIISRQHKLRFLKVNPQSFSPDPAKLSESRPPRLTFPFQIEAIEGSLWLLKNVLPPTVFPRKLRFWDCMDPFTKTVTVPPDFPERLRYVHFLSYCCSWEEEKWSPSEFPALLSQLPRLHTLEIVIRKPGDSAVAIWMTSKFAASLLSSSAMVKELVVSMPSIQFRHVGSLLGYLSDFAFKDIGSLSALEVGVFGQEYLRMTRENRVAGNGGFKKEDWLRAIREWQEEGQHQLAIVAAEYLLKTGGGFAGALRLLINTGHYL